MEFLQLLQSSIEALTLNKLRTALATLGIVIGIASVIALVSIGQAGQKSVDAQIKSLGSNLLTVLPGSQTSGAVRGAAGGSTTLTLADAEAISNSPQINTVQAVSPEFSKRAQISAGSTNTNTQITGATDTYAQVHNITMSSGIFISKIDSVSQNKVAVLGPQVVSDLFNGGDPVGQFVRINKLAFRVIGVTQSKGGSGFQNQDDAVYVPLETAQKQLFGVDYLSDISIAAKDPNSMTEAQNQVGYLLLARHKFSNPTQADFSILSQADILGAANQITGIFTTLLSGIAAISLLVGGIGIMNIMLVTVTERTREIGLRKALGATKITVTTQFLTESVILNIIGGVLGLVLGVTLSFIFSAILKLPFTLSIESVLLAVGVSGGLGILFGWYPAKKASDLSPIEALRYE